MIRWRRLIVNGLVGWGMVNLFLLYFGMSMTDYDFRDIVTKPDNVPIVGLLILVGCFFWYALRRAVINDARIAQGLPSLEELEPDKTLTWPDLVYTELICMVILDDRAGRLGNRPAGPAGTAGELDRRPQPVEGPLVLPGTAGDARLLRSLDGRAWCCRA